jgi:hypothetical protein
MGLSKAQEAKRYARGARKPKHRTSTERVRLHRERKRAEEVTEVDEMTVQRRVESFPHTVCTELRRAIRNGCLRPLEFFADRDGKLHSTREILSMDSWDSELEAERQAHAEQEGEWPTVDDVTVSAGAELTYQEGRYWAVADAVAATADSLGIELVTQ